MHTSTASKPDTRNLLVQLAPHGLPRWRLAMVFQDIVDALPTLAPTELGRTQLYIEDLDEVIVYGVPAATVEQACTELRAASVKLVTIVSVDERNEATR